MGFSSSEPRASSPTHRGAGQADDVTPGGGRVYPGWYTGLCIPGCISPIYTRVCIPGIPLPYPGVYTRHTLPYLGVHRVSPSYPRVYIGYPFSYPRVYQGIPYYTHRCTKGYPTIPTGVHRVDASHTHGCT